jgi:hypothetical protein
MISEEIVEATWRDTAALSRSIATAGIGNLGKLQPTLFRFVITEAEAFSRPANELAVYMFFVVSRMFYGKTTHIRKINSVAVRRHEAAIISRLESLQGAHDAFLQRAAEVLSSREPFVFRYVIETIVEAPTSEADPIPLSEAEQGAIFILLATAIECLTSATQRA